MPLPEVLLTDTFDQWRQKDNELIDTINSLAASGTVLSITSASPGEILVFNGTTFANVQMTGSINIDSSGNTSVVSGALGGLTKGRIRFSGSMTTLY